MYTVLCFSTQKQLDQTTFHCYVLRIVRNDVLMFMRANLQNRLYIIEKSSGNVLKTKYRSEQPFFCFHMGNAYETDEMVSAHDAQ